MIFDIKDNGRETLSISYAGAVALDYPAAVAGAALKAAALRAVAVRADAYRALIASASAGKLAEYRFKEDIARDVAAADEAELALLDREAAARGIDRAALLAIISAKAAVFRRIALLVGVIQAEVSAALRAVPDAAADIEAQIAAILDGAQQSAKLAFDDAQAQLNAEAP